MMSESEIRIDPPDWPSAIADAAGPQVVVGGPGSGKTEFLVRRAIHLIDVAGVPASALVVLGFGRRGTADLDGRIHVGLRGSRAQVPVSTFHSLAARIVERHAADTGWERPPQVLTGPEQVDLVRRLLAGGNRAHWSPAYRGLLGSTTFAREVTDFILRSREQVLSADEISALCRDRDDWRGIPEFMDAYDAALRSEARIDYGTLLAEAVGMIEGGRDLGTAGQERFVLVDEYQDTTEAQARLLAALAGDGGNLTVAGDPYQSIYSFRGADLNNIQNFTSRFRDRTEAEGRRFVLTTSFRTPKAILEAAVRVTAKALPGAAGPVHPAPGNGRVDVFKFDQETEEAEWIAEEMHRMHLEDRLPYSRMGVFVRSKQRFLPELYRALDRRGVPHDVPDARLADRSAVRFVLDLVAATIGTAGPAEVARAVRRILLGAMYEVPLSRLRTIERARFESESGSWSQAIRHAIPEASSLADLLDGEAWAVAMPASTGLWQVWQHLAATVEVATDPDRSDARAEWSSLSRVLGRWNERNPAATLAEYQRLTEEEEFEARPLLSYRDTGSEVPTITTLHQCKGLEFDVVFIADAVEGVFPDLRSRDSLLGVRHLLTHVPADASGYRSFRLNEERRLAYTAMCRARRRVVWTATSTGFEEGRGIPSRFLALVAGTATVSAGVSRPPPHPEPVTPRQAEGLLRRTFQDPNESSPRRLAALTVLAEQRDPRMRSPADYAGMRRRGPDDGLLPKRLTLSPSQAQAYDACPRRYVLERRLRIGAGSSVYLEFGSLIHGVLEATERRALASGHPHGRFAEAAEEFESAFDPGAFGGPPYSAAWYRRGLDALEHMYGNWPSQGSVVSVEHPLELEMAGVSWRGRADRVEVSPSGIGIVDYKTSRSPTTVAEAAESLQLGFYMLAAAQDPVLQPHGRPAAAEMWYPAASGRSVVRRKLDPANLDGVSARLETAAQGILAEDWTPAPGPQCKRCPQRPVCPAWLEGKEAFV